MRRVFRLLPWLASLGVIATVALLGHTWWFVSSAEARFPRHGELVQAGPVRLHYRSAGEGAPVVLLHGASSNLREFEGNLFDALSGHTRVFNFDRPGYGYSDRPSGDWPDPARQATYLHTALQELGVQRPLLIGHSWSGSLVLAYALAYPDQVRGVVLLAGGSHPWRGGVAWYVELADKPALGDLFASTLVPLLGNLMTPAAVRHVFWPEPVPAGYDRRAGLELALRPQTFQASSQDVHRLSAYLRGQSERYPDLQVPVLLISGTHDHVVPAWNHAARLVMQTGQARVELLRGAGHGLHHTRTDAIVSLVRQFIAQHP